MVLFNYSTKEITAKIVYYGPGLGGKTTNLQFIYDNLPATINKGKMLSLATKTDRTLFFDFLPIDLGTIRGLRTRLQLYTVPGQVFYNTTRKLVLKGADGVVFVADSQKRMVDANLESFRNLEDNLAEHGLKMAEMPLIVQFNKRDLPDVLSLEELNAAINRYNSPIYEAVATTGIGVHETLRAATRLVLNALRERYAEKRDDRVEPSVQAAVLAAMQKKPVDRASQAAAAAGTPAPPIPAAPLRAQGQPSTRPAGNAEAAAARQAATSEIQAPVEMHPATPPADTLAWRPGTDEAAPPAIWPAGHPPEGEPAVWMGPDDFDPGSPGGEPLLPVDSREGRAAAALDPYLEEPGTGMPAMGHLPSFEPLEEDVPAMEIAIETPPPADRHGEEEEPVLLDVADDEPLTLELADDEIPLLDLADPLDLVEDDAGPAGEQEPDGLDGGLPAGALSPFIEEDIAPEPVPIPFPAGIEDGEPLAGIADEAVEEPAPLPLSLYDVEAGTPEETPPARAGADEVQAWLSRSGYEEEEDVQEGPVEETAIRDGAGAASDAMEDGPLDLVLDDPHDGMLGVESAMDLIARTAAPQPPGPPALEGAPPRVTAEKVSAIAPCAAMHEIVVPIQLAIGDRSIRFDLRVSLDLTAALSAAQIEEPRR